jgi:Cu(I)/Ag(I) efflux system membrane fusion protein
MKSRFFNVGVGLILFLLGAAAATVVIWNPLHWSWADAVTLRLRATNHASQAPQTNEASGATAASTMVQKPARKIKYWRAPMDPNYISNKPGKSPMGMDLIPVYEDEQPQASGIHVDPNFLQNFAVRTVKAERGSIPVDIRTIGVLDYNQKNLAMVNTKFEGWIEKAQVNYVGEPVSKGQVLFEIYSPQLVTTEQEYLSTLAYVQKLEQGADSDAVARARSLLNSTRERLHYWDVTDDQINQLERGGKIMRTLKVMSPVSGVVVSKMSDSLEGVKLAPGMNVYKIADLSTIWASIEVYEDQIRYMQPGRRADITVDAFPNRHWSGKVIYLDPTVNQQTRTLKAFVEISNPDQKLRPQMYANVEVKIPVVSGVVKVPEEAVLHSGESSVVIVETAKGVFDPRQVELGALGDGYREILKGVRAGEMVVVSSQFLIDSEANLKAAIQQMLNQREAEAEHLMPASSMPPPKTQPSPAEHQH